MCKEHCCCCCNRCYRKAFEDYYRPVIYRQTWKPDYTITWTASDEYAKDVLS